MKKISIITGLALLISVIALISTVFAEDISYEDADWSSMSVRQGESGYVVLTVENAYDEQIRITAVRIHFDWQKEGESFVDYYDSPQYLASGNTLTGTVSW